VSFSWWTDCDYSRRYQNIIITIIVIITITITITVTITTIAIIAKCNF
jgi:hypothetical protein